MKRDIEFAQRLREYRGQKTQAEVAALLDISLNYYGQLERGLKLPSFEMIRQIVYATGKDANYWLGIDTIDTDTPSSTSAPPPSSADATIATIKEDAETILSLLKKLSDDTGARRLAEKTINRDTSIPQIIAVVAQLRAYLSEIDHDTLPEPDRRTISDLLAACQRIMDDTEHPTANFKQGRRLA